MFQSDWDRKYPLIRKPFHKGNVCFEPWLKLALIKNKSLFLTSDYKCNIHTSCLLNTVSGKKITFFTENMKSLKNLMKATCKHPNRVYENKLWDKGGVRDKKCEVVSSRKWLCLNRVNIISYFGVIRSDKPQYKQNAKARKWGRLNIYLSSSQTVEICCMLAWLLS